MAVISVSLNEETIRILDEIQEYFELGGRSEAIRTALKITGSEIRDMKSMNGDLEGVMVVVHNSHNDQWMNIIQHRYERIIKTQMHSHLQNGRCLEVLILSGDADLLEKMTRDMHSTGKAEYMKFVKSR